MSEVEKKNELVDDLLQDKNAKQNNDATIKVLISISTLGMLYGLINNIIYKIGGAVVYFEIFMLVLNAIMYLSYRADANKYKLIARIMVIQFFVFFMYLYYAYKIEDLKFLWIYIYPIFLLYLEEIHAAGKWILLTSGIILIAPFQPFVEVSHSWFEVSYIAFVFITITVMAYMHKVQMLKAQEIIARQRVDLERKYQELKKKDSMLTAQSKQAVMGEMMSMIAHQWRQPLSTVTLNISNLQFKKMLGQEISDEELDKAFNEISDTVVYLSDTVDDFQTFFRPKKEKTEIEIHELLQKAVNFVTPRIKENQIEISISKYVEIKVVTYANELVQMILNILNNAIDALSQAKREKAKIILYVELKGEYIYISIVDNADGISEEDADNIFDPYFSTKGKNGTGLGLYMSQMLAQKQFDGEITFTSSHLGTHFVIKVKKDISS